MIELVRVSFVVHGGFSDWEDWSACSTTCGEGQQTRARTCTNPSPAHGGNECNADSEMTQSCNVGKCPGNYRIYEINII